MNAEGLSTREIVVVSEAASEAERPAWHTGLATLGARKFQEIAGLDLRSLAVFRMGLGLILLVDLYIRSGDLLAHYTDKGILPRDMLNPAERRLSIHLFGGAYWFEALLFGVAALFALALLVGIRTRMATCLSWFLLVSLQARNPIVLQAGDMLLRMLLFWGMFLPLGTCWSVDSSAAPHTEDRPWRITCLATIALLLQICLVYWCSAALKSDPSWRTEGTAVYYALNIDQLVTPFGEILLDYPRLLWFLTFATLGLEALGPLLLFCPVHNGWIRFVVVLVFVAFHVLGLGLCLELGPFPYVCAVAWIVLLPTCFWEEAARRWPIRSRPQGTLTGRVAHLLHRGKRLLRFFAPILAEEDSDENKPLARRSDFFILSRIALFAALIYVLLWNLRSLDFSRFSKFFPVEANGVGVALGLDQYWAMFAPMPTTNDGWYVIEGELHNGSKVDLFRDGAPLSWRKPEAVAKMYANERWRKLGTNLHQKDFARYRVPYARYLARQWNARHEPDLQLKSVKIYFMLEVTQPNYETLRVEKLLLEDYHCTAADNAFP